MTSRERVTAAVNFREPDRVPIDLGGTRASGINAVVYDRLKRRMGISTPTKLHDPMQILAELEPEMIDRLAVDVVPLEAATARKRATASASGAERSRLRRGCFRRRAPTRAAPCTLPQWTASSTGRCPRASV